MQFFNVNIDNISGHQSSKNNYRATLAILLKLYVLGRPCLISFGFSVSFLSPFASLYRVVVTLVLAL